RSAGGRAGPSRRLRACRPDRWAGRPVEDVQLRWRAGVDERSVGGVVALRRAPGLFLGHGEGRTAVYLDDRGRQILAGAERGGVREVLHSSALCTRVYQVTG